jgi:carboxylesterase type B
MIRTGPLINVDMLIGVTADESLYFAEEHMFNHYLPKKYRSRSLTKINSTKLIEQDKSHGFFYFKKNKYIKNYLQTNYPNHLCFYDEIQARYMPNQHNLTEIAQRYTNLISDLMFYYDLVRFLRERLHSESSASTYVYYYTYPPIFNLENVFRRIPNMVGHFAEIDLIWGIPFFNRTNINMNLSYTSEEKDLSFQMIRYWTNFAKTGN